MAAISREGCLKGLTLPQPLVPQNLPSAQAKAASNRQLAQHRPPQNLPSAQAKAASNRQLAQPLVPQNLLPGQRQEVLNLQQVQPPDGEKGQVKDQTVAVRMVTAKVNK